MSMHLLWTLKDAMGGSGVQNHTARSKARSCRIHSTRDDPQHEMDATKVVRSSSRDLFAFSTAVTWAKAGQEQ